MRSVIFDRTRESDSPYIERVWTSHSEHGGHFVSAAESRWEVVIARLCGVTTLFVRGPESRATNATCPPTGEWLGIRFRLGTFLRGLPPRVLRDATIPMPASSTKSSWILGTTFENPTMDNVEPFVARLVRARLLTRDPIVAQPVDHWPAFCSTRTLQRRFARIVGLTPNQVTQIDRARHASVLLSEGCSIAGAVSKAGYYDQPHLTRNLTKWMGESPGKIAERVKAGQLSFLYKTSAPSVY